MKYLIGILIALVCAVITYINLNEQIAKKIKLLNVNRDEDACSFNTLTNLKMYIVSGFVFVLSLVASILIFTKADCVVDIVKMDIALICITGAAAMDYREHRIPNIYPLVMAISGIVCLLVLHFTNPMAMGYLYSSVVATVGVSVCLLLAMIITKQGIGMGDIKLLSSLALISGVYGVCGTIFFAMVTCAVLAIILLATKKKNLQSSLPFGPFILVGYLFTIFASLY